MLLETFLDPAVSPSSVSLFGCVRGAISSSEVLLFDLVKSALAYLFQQSMYVCLCYAPFYATNFAFEIEPG